MALLVVIEYEPLYVRWERVAAIIECAAGHGDEAVRGHFPLFEGAIDEGYPCVS